MTHAPELPGEKLLESLEPFLTHANPLVRRDAIRMIGAVGDIDTAEGLLALPDAPTHRDDILEAVSAIGKRPINLLALRPEAFEVFIGRLLRWMKYHRVQVKPYSHDHGIDVECYKLDDDPLGDPERKWIVQCKRYSKAPIDEETVRQFDMRIDSEAHCGLFVTTSRFTTGARDYATTRRRLKLLSRDELLAFLKDRFGPERYVIRPREGQRLP